jgi:hypothetical protein
VLAAFVAWEAHVPHPMMPLRLFRDPRFAVASGAVAILFFGLAGVTFMLTQIYQFVLGYSPLAAGVRSLPSAVALTLAVPAGTRLAARAGLNVAVASGLLAMSAGLGSVLGVAALGSLAATANARGMAILPGVPRPAVAAARGSISAATQVTSSCGPGMRPARRTRCRPRRRTRSSTARASGPWAPRCSPSAPP